MKRSKIFIAISSAILAAAGIATTKVQNATNYVKYRDERNLCVIGLVTQTCPGLKSSPCKQTVYTTSSGVFKISSSHIYTLYTLINDCTQFLYTQT